MTDKQAQTIVREMERFFDGAIEYHFCIDPPYSDEQYEEAKRVLGINN